MKKSNKMRDFCKNRTATPIKLAVESVYKQESEKEEPVVDKQEPIKESIISFIKKRIVKKKS